MPMNSDAAASSLQRYSVAAFDVDKTLTTKDCVVPFLREVAGWRWYLGLLSRSVPLTIAVVRRDRDKVKNLVTQAALRGRSATHVEIVAQRFAERVFPAWLRSDTVDRLHWHKAQGHRVVLVSASYRLYLVHLAAQLGCAAVLATECEMTPDGLFTGSLLGENCRGVEKERRLRHYFATEGLTAVNLFAYGDSKGDDHMLAMADHPLRIDHLPVTVAPEMSMQ